MKKVRWYGFCSVTVVFLLSALLPAGAGAGPASLKERICEEARREGAVHVLTNVREVAEPIEKALQEKYPWMTVRSVTDVAAPTRLITEAQAGRFEHDLFVWSIPGVLPAYQRGLLAKFRDEELAAFGVAKGTALLQNSLLSFSSAIHALGYDTRRVRDDEAPRRWSDLVQPRWQGRLAGEITSVTNGVAALGLLLGEAWALDFARKLRDVVRVTITPSPTLARDMVLRGEKDLVWTTLGTLMDRRERYGEPFGWAPVSPTYAARFVVTVLERAPHPNAARCASLWLVTREGQAKREQISYGSADAAPGSTTRMRKEIERMRIRVFFENAEAAQRRLSLYGRLLPILQGRAD